MVKVNLSKESNGEEYWKITVISHFIQDESITDTRRQIMRRALVLKDENCSTKIDAENIGKKLEGKLLRRAQKRSRTKILLKDCIDLFKGNAF